MENLLRYPPIFFGEEPDSEAGIGIVRVQNILRSQTAAAMRTLEMKICESGPPAQQITPDVLTYAIKRLKATSVVIGRRETTWPCEMFYLERSDGLVVEKVLEQKLALLRTWNDFASKTGPGTLGPHAEQLIGKAFANSASLITLQWGNITHVGDLSLPRVNYQPGSADGLVMLPANAFHPNIFGLVEVKNRREQIAPNNPIIWDLIRKVYAVNAVPILIARRMYRSTKSYVFSRIGGFGIDIFCQLVPSGMESSLRACKHKDGLGFKDLDFNDRPPPGLLKMLDVLAKQMPTCMDRLLEVRHIVTPHLDILANATLLTGVREEAYRRLQSDLDRHDAIPSSYGRLLSRKRALKIAYYLHR
jgi:hypothetical protein